MVVTNNEQRTLAAIMFTDMVGYSALTQRNETLALELLQEHFQILRGLLPQHQGKEIKTTGDGLFVEFSSALSAVQCAVEIQRALAERNQSKPADHQVRIRIGIHLGDVVRRDNDVFGDGVNIAARIEPLALPGGICVSEDIERQIRNKVSYPTAVLDEVKLKNIELAVAAYRIVLPWEDAELTTTPPAVSPTPTAIKTNDAITIISTRPIKPPFWKRRWFRITIKWAAGAAALALIGSILEIPIANQYRRQHAPEPQPNLVFSLHTANRETILTNDFLNAYWPGNHKTNVLGGLFIPKPNEATNVLIFLRVVNDSTNLAEWVDVTVWIPKMWASLSSPGWDFVESKRVETGVWSSGVRKTNELQAFGRRFTFPLSRFLGEPLPPLLLTLGSTGELHSVVTLRAQSKGIELTRLTFTLNFIDESRGITNPFALLGANSNGWIHFERR